MAAITIKFGVQSDVTALDSAQAQEPPVEESASLARARGFAGLGDANAITDIDQKVLAASHNELVSMVYLRRACEEVLEGRSIHVTFEGRDVWLNLDRPLEAEPAWNPPTKSGLTRFKLLSWTSKMGTPSFSLPAGAAAMGGACPGAAGGQSLVQIQTRAAQQREVERLTGVPVVLSRCICQRCYAEGGQYSTGQVQYAQLMRFAWTQQAVLDGTFAEVMSWAVQRANYALDGKGNVKEKDENGAPVVVPARGERDSKRYFRIHDSGDFFSPEYVAAWKLVADDNPDVTFWAPSRAWAVKGLREAVNEINNPPRNLIIRPSAYMINEPGPRALGPGWAAGSTVYADANKPDMEARREGPPYQWDCQAYQTDNDKVTCRDARAPDGEIGCRACWRFGLEDEHGNEPGLIVNYTLH